MLGSNACGEQRSVQVQVGAAEFSLQAFQELRWLEGTWRAETVGDPPFFERYRFVNDSTIEITYFADSTLVTATGSGSVALRPGRIVHEWEDARWAATGRMVAG